MKYIIIILLSVFAGTYCQFCGSGNLNGDICCPKKCGLCGTCFKNNTELNRQLNMICCPNYIHKNCINTLYNPPCVVPYLFQDGDSDNYNHDSSHIDFKIICIFVAIGIVFLVCFCLCALICINSGLIKLNNTNSDTNSNINLKNYESFTKKVEI